MEGTEFSKKSAQGKAQVFSQDLYEIFKNCFSKEFQS